MRKNELKTLIRAARQILAMSHKENESFESLKAYVNGLLMMAGAMQKSQWATKKYVTRWAYRNWESSDAMDHTLTDLTELLDLAMSCE
jgi:hypothetical protein